MNSESSDELGGSFNDDGLLPLMFAREYNNNNYEKRVDN